MEAKEIRKNALEVHLKGKEQHKPISVREKIFQVQHQGFRPGEKTGPEMEFFFHELTNKEKRSKRVLDVIFAMLGFIPLILCYPFIALGIKLSSKGSVIQTIKTEGRAGRIFDRFVFRTSHNAKHVQSLDTKKHNEFSFGRFLRSSGIYKWPSLIVVLQGNMSMVGPMAYPQNESMYWTGIFDDFYKRYAVKPGFIPVYEVRDKTFSMVKRQLKKDFKYVVSPSLKKDFKILLGNF